MIPQTLDDVLAQGVPETYPVWALDGCKDGLVLFAAAFYGKQDAVWMAKAGMNVTCVDTDRDKMAAMFDIYPGDWRWIVDDVYATVDYFLERDVQFDVVSADPYTNQFEQCRKLTHKLCALARRTMIVGTGSYRAGVREPFHTLPGWTQHPPHYRSSFEGGTYWAVFTK